MKIAFSLAGIYFYLQSAHPKINIKINRRFRKFISPSGQKPGIAINVAAGEIGKLTAGIKPLIQSQHWKFYKKNSRYLIESLAPFKRLAIIRESPRIDIILDKNRAKKSVYHPFSVDDTLLKLVLIHALQKQTGLLIHGAGMVFNGAGVAFIGPSGAGKSTLARLWQDNRQARILNDECIIFRRVGGRFFIFGSPWHGDNQTADPGGVLLKKIYFLQKSAGNKITEIKNKSLIWKKLYQEIYFPFIYKKKNAEYVFKTLEKIACQADCAVLKFKIGRRIIGLLKERINNAL